MTRPHTILLVPHDPSMLAEGLGGCRPPVMIRRPWGGPWWLFDSWTTNKLPSGDDLIGLVIAHEGKPHEIGIAWLAAHSGKQSRWVSQAAVSAFWSRGSDGYAATVLSEWGALVYLDADGEVLHA